MEIAFTYASVADALAALASAALIKLYIFSLGKGFERLVPYVPKPITFAARKQGRILRKREYK